MGKAFTPRTVAAMEGRVAQIVDDLVAEHAAAGACDLVRDLAYPLPVSVIFELIGFPMADRDLVKSWSARIIRVQSTSPPDPAILHDGQDALISAREWLTDLIELRRLEPRDDLLSALIAAEIESDQLTIDELFVNVLALLVAGHETTTNLISSGMYTLMSNPDQLALLRENPELISTAVEEMLRFEPPLQFTWRRASRDLSLRGREIQQGQPVYVMLAAGNRDSDQFENPNRVDITRPDNRHLTFGMGIHFCLGAALARTEARLMIGALVTRLSDLTLADNGRVQWVGNRKFRSLVTLPARF
jgi:pimeloyl-[acyl-carrier protein] synthase